MSHVSTWVCGALSDIEYCLSSTTSQYKVFGTTTTKQLHLPLFTKLTKITKPQQMFWQHIKPTIFCPAIVYKIYLTLTPNHITLTLNIHSKNLLHISFIYCPCCITHSFESSSFGSRWSCRLQSTRIHMLATSIIDLWIKHQT